MKRRDVLRRTCGALAVGAAAGCLSTDGGGNAEGGTDTTDRTDSTDADGGTRTETEHRPTTQRATEREQSDGTGDGRSIETTRTDCRSEDDADAASVAFGDRAVEITGTMIVANPCHVAAFGAVERGDDELTVLVEAADDDEEVCVECEGVVDYAAAVAVDDPPGAVTVKHRSRNRTRTVETASAD